MSKICPIFVPYISQICPRYVQDSFQVCLRYVPDIPHICPKPNLKATLSNEYNQQTTISFFSDSGNTTLVFFVNIRLLLNSSLMHNIFTEFQNNPKHFQGHLKKKTMCLYIIWYINLLYPRQVFPINASEKSSMQSIDFLPQRTSSDNMCFFCEPLRATEVILEIQL